MKTTSISILFMLITFMCFSQDKNKPVFAAGDAFEEYGEWQTKQYTGKKGAPITISYRSKVNKKFAMTCLFSIEIRNDGEEAFKVNFAAGNKGTGYYTGQIGVVREKVNLAPKETKVIDYRLPTMDNEKADADAVVCKKCKEMDHSFGFAR